MDDLVVLSFLVLYTSPPESLESESSSIDCSRFVCPLSSGVIGVECEMGNLLAGYINCSFIGLLGISNERLCGLCVEDNRGAGCPASVTSVAANCLVGD